MKNSIVLLGMLVSLAVMAEPGIYEGTGQMGVPGKTAASYRVRLDVKEVVPQKEYIVTESWLTQAQQAKAQAEGRQATFQKDGSSITNTFKFNANGTLQVLRNGTVVGCGYHIMHGKGNHWLNYELETDYGKIHINQYFNAETKELHRLGDILNLDGPSVVHDDMKLVQ